MGMAALDPRAQARISNYIEEGAYSMSWSANLQTPASLDQAEDGFTVEDFNVSPPYNSLHPEPKAQFERAQEAAEELIISGVVGDMDGQKFTVTMSGHANPNHEPVSGMARDFVSLTISQVINPPEVAEALQEQAEAEVAANQA
jgi:hypothetical protein